MNIRFFIRYAVLVLMLTCLFPKDRLVASTTTVYQGPVLIKGKQIRPILGFRLRQYGLFKKDPNGNLVPIPFQIDEVDRYDDYVLGHPLKGAPRMIDNGIFDENDELVFRGKDIGAAGDSNTALHWKSRPYIAWEIVLENPILKKTGSVYIGLFLEKPAQRFSKNLVTYQHDIGLINTSKYRLKFNPKNQMLIDNVKIRHPKDANILTQVIDGSMFHFHGDIKFFFTLDISSSDLETRLEYWKLGPVRWIAQISFYFKLMSMNLDIAMYTEVSVFENAVMLPTILNSPVDAKKLFRKGSGFYYGLKLTPPLKEWHFSSDMMPLLDISDQDVSNRKSEDLLKNGYTVTGNRGEALEFSLRLFPSMSLIKENVQPFMQLNNVRPRKWMQKLTTNTGLFMDTSNLSNGDYKINVIMHFDNQKLQPRGHIAVKKVRTIRN